VEFIYYTGPVPVIYNRPPPPPRPGWQGAGIGPAQMFPGPPITRPPPGFPPFHPGASLPPTSVPLMQIDPVIINPNEGNYNHFYHRIPIL
jgi:hypothetical protein